MIILPIVIRFVTLQAYSLQNKRTHVVETVSIEKSGYRCEKRRGKSTFGSRSPSLKMDSNSITPYQSEIREINIILPTEFQTYLHELKLKTSHALLM